MYHLLRIVLHNQNETKKKAVGVNWAKILVYDEWNQ